jgi:hypothetical protein
MPSDSDSDSSSGWANFASAIEEKQKKKMLPLAPSDDEWDTFVAGIVASHQTDDGKVPIQKEPDEKSDKESHLSASSEEPSYGDTVDEFLPDSPLVEFNDEQSLEEFSLAGEVPLLTCFYAF